METSNKVMSWVESLMLLLLIVAFMLLWFIPVEDNPDDKYLRQLTVKELREIIREERSK